MSSEHEEKHLHIHLPPGLMQSAYIASSPTYFDSREEQLRQIRTRQVEKSTDFSKEKKAFLEGISGNAPECWAINYMLPLHNFLLPKRTEYLKQKLCTKKYITIKKIMNPGGWAGYSSDRSLLKSEKTERESEV